MSTTTTRTRSVRDVLDSANPNDLPDALRKIKLGTMLYPLKRAFTGLTAAAAFDLTAIDGTGETTGAGNPNRLGALAVKTLRVITTGTAASVGSYIVGDTGATPTLPTGGASAGVGIATISDDGKTITFPNTVTAFTIAYIPLVLSTTDLDAAFATT